MSFLKKKSPITILALTLVISGVLGTVNVFADSESDENTTDENQKIERAVGNEYWTSWKIISKPFNKYVYGSWFRIVSGQGGPGVTLSSSVTRTVTNNYTGSLKVSKGTLDSSIGFNSTSSRSETARYSMKCPDSKKRYILRGRDTKSEYKVTQKRTYMVGNITSHSETAVVYPKKWSSFDYGYYTENL